MEKHKQNRSIKQAQYPDNRVSGQILQNSGI